MNDNMFVHIKVGNFLSEVLVLFSALVIIYIYIMIASDVSLSKSRNRLSDISIYGLTILGILLIVIAIIMPFMIRTYFKTRIDNYETIADLGTIGDFIGGTTVAFLTAASVVLLLATIIMQRKEIKISQQSIQELVKQTEATVKQAEEARKETQITNDTMKKQQFETTFFNMVNLHHNILSEIRIKDSTGRDAIKKLWEDLSDIYNKEVYTTYIDQLKKMIIIGEKDILADLIEQWFIDFNLSLYKAKYEENFLPIYDEIGEPDMNPLHEFYKSLEYGTDKVWNKQKKDLLSYFKNNIYGDLVEYKKILERIDFKQAVGRISNVYVDNFNRDFYIFPLKQLKILAYEEVYKDNENVIGHYYRNLYRIVRLIQDEKFDTDHEKNKIEKRKYRGILRAQLSSFELLMIFYNVVYSKKGEKFKEILRNTNFFDDHLITEDFIWKNDNEELANLDLPKI